MGIGIFLSIFCTSLCMSNWSRSIVAGDLKSKTCDFITSIPHERENGYVLGSIVVYGGSNRKILFQTKQKDYLKCQIVQKNVSNWMFYYFTENIIISFFSQNVANAFSSPSEKHIDIFISINVCRFAWRMKSKHCY